MTRPTARLLSKKDAAHYCGYRTARFGELVKDGVLPDAVPGTLRWDKKAIDRALDLLSGLPVESEQSPLERYKASLDANNA